MEPIFWLAGGPGGTNMGFSHVEGLIEDHDIVLVGYRGVDGSSALDCPEENQAAKGLGGDLLKKCRIRILIVELDICDRVDHLDFRRGLCRQEMTEGFDMGPTATENDPLHLRRQIRYYAQQLLRVQHFPCGAGVVVAVVTQIVAFEGEDPV